MLRMRRLAHDSRRQSTLSFLLLRAQPHFGGLHMDRFTPR